MTNTTYTTIIITVCFIHSQTEPIDILEVYPYTTLIIQIVYLSLILLKRGNVGCCCIKQFKLFLFHKCYRTSENAPHLPPAFYPVVDNFDTDLQVGISVMESASLNLQQMAANTESTQRCSQRRTLNMGQIWFPFETMFICSEFVSATMPSNQIALGSLNYVYTHPK